MKQMEEAAQAQAEFRKTRDPELLETADPEARRRILRRWLALLRMLEQSQDPAFNPADVPAVKIRPPRTADGVQFPPGIHPKHIADPAARARYEQARAANREKAEKLAQESRLREYQQEVWESVEHFVRRYYTEARGDRDEMLTVLDEAGVTGEARERLLGNLSRL